MGTALFAYNLYMTKKKLWKR